MKRLLLFVFPFLTLFSISFKNAFAEPGLLDTFAYHKVFNVNGSSAGAVTDYPIKITLDIGEGQDTSSTFYLEHHVLSSFNDIRFSSDDTNLLSYWIESSTSTTATVWVKLDSVPAAPSQKTFYIYYGNSSAPSLSNGADTFSFYDDFDTNGISSWTGSDQNKHTLETATQAVSSVKNISSPNSANLYTHANCGMSPFDGVGSILSRSVNLPSSNYKVEFGVLRDITGFVDNTTAFERSFVLINGSVGLTESTSCSGSNCNVSGSWATKSFDVSNSAITSVGLEGYSDDCTTGNVYFDNVRIRNFINPEPEISLISSQDSSSSSTSTSAPVFNTTAPVCGDQKPSRNPDLFQINTTRKTAKIFFTPSDTNQYFVSFSTSPNAEENGETVTLLREGVQSEILNFLKPNTVYYVKVRGQNGCMPGDWSNILKFKTSGTTFYKYH